jgi:uncharacterized membrane protein (UPF0127 family)
MELTLIRDNGQLVCRRCRLADTPISRIKGLLGRRGLDDDEGMLLGTWAIHTTFMRFPIDLVFLDRNYVVLRTVKGLKPWRAAVERRAHAVAELAPGAVDRAGVEVGDQISLVRHGAGIVADEASGAELGPLRTLRVVVASSDSRFLRVVRFLLARHAFEVDTYRDVSALTDKDTERADVIVLDSSTSLAVAARVMRDVSVSNPTTGFVVVGERSGNPEESNGSATRSLRILPKWDSFDRLVDEIRIASAVGGHRELA